MKYLFSLFLLFVAVSATLKKNPYFSTVEGMKKWLEDSTIVENARYPVSHYFESVDTLEGRSIWMYEAVENSNHREDEEGNVLFEYFGDRAYVLYDWDKDMIMCGRGIAGGINFGRFSDYDDNDNECFSVQIEPFKRDRLKFIMRYLIKEHCSNMLEMAKEKIPRELNSKEDENVPFSLSFVGGRIWHVIPITASNVVVYNDVGYVLEQKGKYKEAIEILKAVIKAFPNRTVAYLNIADAYWGISDTTNARRNYCRYIELMKARKLENKIPLRATARCSAAKP